MPTTACRPALQQPSLPPRDWLQVIEITCLSTSGPVVASDGIGIVIDPLCREEAMKIARVAATLIALLGLCPMAQAVPVFATTYDMPNGNGQASGGSLNYWDRNYSGSGSTTIDGAPLSGGLGKLTDGVASTQPWYLVSNDAGTGEYVGWYRTLNPLITFNFAGDPLIDEITVYLDNTHIGGVYAPSAILIDGISRSFTAPAVGSVGPVDFTALGLTGGSHTIQLNQDAGRWVFVSEISFAGAAAEVPEPAPLALVALGLAGLACVGRRRADA
jgi:hypothetical protein